MLLPYLVFGSFIYEVHEYNYQYTQPHLRKKNSTKSKNNKMGKKYLKNMQNI